MSEKILIVEDDEYMRESLENELCLAGYDVTIASNGQQAIELAREQHFDLVVCDIRMPGGMGGLETLSNLRQHLPVARSIVITGYASHDAPIQAVKMQVDDYLLKPFSSQQLLASVRQALDRYIAELRKSKGVARLRATFVDLIQSVRTRRPSDRVTQAALRLCALAGFSLLRSKSVQLATWFLGEDSALLENIQELHELGLFLQCAEELWDGSGPRALRGDQIPLESRILAAAQAYEQILEAGTFPQGLQDLAGVRLDPHLVDQLVLSGDHEVDLARVGEPSTPVESLLSLAESYLRGSQAQLAEDALLSLSPTELAGENELRYRTILLECRILAGETLLSIEMASHLVDFCRQRGFDLAGANVTLMWARLTHPHGSPAKALFDTPLYEALERAQQIFLMWEYPRERTACLLYLAARAPEGIDRFLESLRESRTFEVLEEHPELAQSIVQSALLRPGGVEQVALSLSGGGEAAVGPLERISQGEELSPRLRALEVLAALPDQDARTPQRLDSNRSTVGLDSQATNPETQLQVHLLGKFRFFRGSELVDDEQFKTRKARSLFAYFCAHRGESLEEGALADIFWPHLPKASHSLQNAVSQIRKLLEQQCGPTARDFLTKRRMGYQMVGGDWLVVDLEDFQRHCKRGLQLVQQRSWNEALAELKKAEPLYGGEFLEGVFEDWTESQRVALTSQWHDLLTALAQYFFERKKYDISLDYWKKILLRDSCCEQAYLGSMMCHIALERKSEAVKCYNQCVQKLRQELNLTPSIPLLELYLKVTSGAQIELLMPTF